MASQTETKKAAVWLDPMHASAIVLGIMIVIGLFLAGMFTLTVAAYVGFVVSCVLVARFSERLGVVEGEYARPLLIFGSLGLIFGLIGETRTLSLPGLAFVLVGGVLMMRGNTAETKRRVDEAERRGLATGREELKVAEKARLEAELEAIAQEPHTVEHAKSTASG